MQAKEEKNGPIANENRDEWWPSLAASGEINHLKYQKLINFRGYILAKCAQGERQLRRYFCLEDDKAEVAGATLPCDTAMGRIVDGILNVQLMNFLYDTYIRMLMSGYQQQIIAHPSPALACLKQALDKLDFTLAQSRVATASITAEPWYAETTKGGRKISLSSLRDMAAAFDDLTLMFDVARKRGSILSLDLVLPEYLDKLTDVPRVATPMPSSQIIGVILRDHQQDGELLADETAAAVDSWRYRVRWLSVFQTFYRTPLDGLMIDHSQHRESVYIPVYRFGDGTVSSMSMSSYIGNTMRYNIRQLYDFISNLLIDLPCAKRICPCVVIFNLFVRDYFRVYHSKSLPQTSFIQIYDDETGDNVKVSYMLIANKFPKITQWFNSINNQFLKKTGYARILHIDAYARLISNACESSRMRLKAQIPVKTKKNRLKKSRTNKTGRTEAVAGPASGNRRKPRRQGLLMSDRQAAPPASVRKKSPYRGYLAKVYLRHANPGKRWARK